jgi:hypothetical protein
MKLIFFNFIIFQFFYLLDSVPIILINLKKIKKVFFLTYFIRYNQILKNIFQLIFHDII